MSKYEDKSLRDKVISICGQGNVWSQDYLRHSLINPERVDDDDENSNDQQETSSEIGRDNCSNSDQDSDDDASDMPAAFAPNKRHKNEINHGLDEGCENRKSVASVKTECTSPEVADNVHVTGMKLEENVGKALVAAIRKELHDSKISCASDICDHPMDVNAVMRPITKVIRSACK